MSARGTLAALVMAVALLPGAAPAQDGPAPDPAAQVDAAPPMGAGTPLAVLAPSGPLLLGDRFELVVTGAIEDGAHLAVDALPDGLLAGDARTERTPDGLALHLPLRAVREGALRVDGLAVVSGLGDRAVPPVELQVKLDLPPGRVPRVADPLAPVAVPMPPAQLLPFLIGLPIALLMLGTYAALAGRRVPPPPPIRRPPEVVATEALGRLRSQLPRTRDEVPAFVTAISTVLRTYIEDVFALRAPESTTEEFLLEVASRHDQLGRHRDALGGFLTACDLVKFARHRPDPSAAVPLLSTAENFVEESHS